MKFVMKINNSNGPKKSRKILLITRFSGAVKPKDVFSKPFHAGEISRMATPMMAIEATATRAANCWVTYGFTGMSFPTSKY
jgi:hypothetical protein